jgi:CsoR family transcriptional regulator, copper-sensing transcriptional repressor
MRAEVSEGGVAMSVKESSPEMFLDLIKRMKRIEGQARGIQRLLEEDAECDAIVIQLSAMKEALSRVGVMVSTCQLGKLITEEVQAGGSGERSLKEMMQTFLRL